MTGMIEFEFCPSCGHERSVRLAPPGQRVETTLGLIAGNSSHSGLGPDEIASLMDIDFVICSRCALIYMPRRSTPAAAKTYYSKLFHLIETPLPFEELPLSERFVRRKRAFARDLIRTLDDHGVLATAKSVLYVRCNVGEGPRLLRDEYGIDEVYGLELLPSCIRHAREVYGLEHVERLFAPEFDNPFLRRRFDLILCDEAFAHAHDPVGVARTLASLLNEGGAIVAFKEKDHSQILRSPRLFPHGMNFFHKQLFTRRSLRAFLELQGFSVEQLPHPTVGKPDSRKNSKILFLLRPDGRRDPEFPSDEVAPLILDFRRWLSAYRWRGRGQRVLSVFRARSTEAGIGGAARR
jgi:SAM-dependent methyltransferase